MFSAPTSRPPFRNGNAPEERSPRAAADARADLHPGVRLDVRADDGNAVRERKPGWTEAKLGGTGSLRRMPGASSIAASSWPQPRDPPRPRRRARPGKPTPSRIPPCSTRDSAGAVEGNLLLASDTDDLLVDRGDDGGESLKARRMELDHPAARNVPDDSGHPRRLAVRPAESDGRHNTHRTSSPGSATRCSTSYGSPRSRDSRIAATTGSRSSAGRQARYASNVPPNVPGARPMSASRPGDHSTRFPAISHRQVQRATESSTSATEGASKADTLRERSPEDVKSTMPSNAGGARTARDRGGHRAAPSGEKR